MGIGSAASQDRIERVAIGASLLCLVHCLVLPIAFATLPFLANTMPIPEQVHVWLLAFVIPAAGIALLSGYLSHRDIRPCLAGSAGLMLLASATLLLVETAWEMPFTVIGSLALILAHALNWSLRHACRRG
ncbi:MerC domain-containing protein [Parasphingopyxis lamellibrachiae]|uniref:MerC mercury resistance protein n=1 Tax=Parasphingopyxis lamellibrachiae TaxID=680125 RepID=A0A3D9FIM2_9SPHN|nr:MerC domain-containing protein [Parasphingopyxis lamellibrachiae]RED17643.1 MerC mercury resistance protein [Parasphingopyxis lamellibrachiae]